MINPTELAQAIVENNPVAVRERLVELNLVAPSYQLSAPSLFALLMDLPTAQVRSKQQALALVTYILDVPIQPNGANATDLRRLLHQYQGNLKELVYLSFEQSLPQMETGITPKSCGCKGQNGPLTSMQWIVLALALLGVFVLFALFIKLTSKLLSA